ncbi:MAG: beta-galactosidase, partial [Bacteroidetes bacterium]|nr:beta-galactosidase [Bacteroidota bacterium]
MKNSRLPHKILISIFLLLTISQPTKSQEIPHLRPKGNTTQLIVDGKPFIILGGELGNSTATTVENMKPVWPKLTAMNLNTVLIPVFWELVEEQEGVFEFGLYEELILEARRNGMKIIFLWFGSWKNSMSSHAPGWVKLNQNKYPRVKDDQGVSQEILSSFSKNVLEADKKAFVKFMEFIRDFDGEEHTVIMVQVENEIGMLPTARDFQALAEMAFQSNVPVELTKYLKKNRESLVPEFKEIWEKNGTRTGGNWEHIFGKGLYTDEIFMAWYYAQFANELTKAGKAVYPLPMFVNAALNRPNTPPGKYPSAGPLPHIMDVWKAGAPDIDFLSPDFYNPDFQHWCDLYTRQNDPL